jgi:DnaJ-class molecular chaperone
MPSLKEKGNYGDLYAKVAIRIPKRLSSRAKQLFQELEGVLKR